MQRNSWMITLLAAGLILPGCSGQTPTARTFSHVHLDNVARDAAFDAVAVALRDRYPLASTDRASGMVRCEPVETPDDASPRRPGEVLGTGRHVRRVATAQVTGNDAACDVWCKIVVEQRDDAAALIYSTELGRSDAPTTTLAATAPAPFGPGRAPADPR